MTYSLNFLDLRNRSHISGKIKETYNKKDTRRNHIEANPARCLHCKLHVNIWEIWNQEDPVEAQHFQGFSEIFNLQEEIRIGHKKMQYIANMWCHWQKIWIEDCFGKFECNTFLNWMLMVKLDHSQRLLKADPLSQKLSIFPRWGQFNFTCTPFKLVSSLQICSEGSHVSFLQWKMIHLDPVKKLN